MNREKIRSEFQSYVSHYDPSDPKIRLKIDHTYRVADLCERIAGSLSLSEEMTEISWICGMLHDIGRFEQVQRFHTFLDAESVDHAKLGAEILFGEEQLIRRFLEDHAHEAVKLADLADWLNLSTNHTCHLVKYHFGKPFHALLLEERLARARRLLENTDLPQKAVAAAAGFPNEFYFNRLFRRENGMPPGEYRRRFKKEETR